MPDLLSRIDISDIQNSLTPEEQEAVLAILNEYSSTGSSATLESFYYEDYEEIPVDIETFILDKRFLGRTFVSDNGKCLVYPFWLEVLKNVFAPNSGIYEVALSGAIGLGKSTIACIGLAYILHRLLCLKNPASYYNLANNAKIAIALFNINLDQGYGVGYYKLQSMLKLSPWFLSNGTLVGTKNITYYPNKNIEILVGSKMEHFIGRDVFCLVGDTEVLTNKGFIKICDLSGNSAKVISQSNNGELISCDADILETARVKEIYEIELEDGTTIKCTGNHKFRLSDGSYKEAKDLTDTDDIMEVTV